MDIFETLRTAADAEKAASMSAYMRNQFAYLGIPKPEREKLSREFMKAIDKTVVDWDFVFTCWEQPEREFQYLACNYLLKVKAALTSADIPSIKRLIVSKSWWDTVDSLDMLVGDIAKRYPELKDLLLSWSTDENIWIRRIAIDHQLMYKENTDTYLLEQILVNNLGDKEFFINKAIGWSLREFSKTNPDWVRAFIETHRADMAALSIREASKYL